MVAFLLSLGLFVFWGLLGYAIVAALLPRRRVLFNLLLAPAVGLAVNVSVVSSLNHAGLPIARFAWPLTLVLGSTTLAFFAWKKPPFSPRRYAPYAGLLLLGLFIVGRPFLKFGFDWISVFNDDMANYALCAQRLTDHGFADPPVAADLLDGRDFTHYYWLLYVGLGSRAGSDTILAWCSVLTGLSPFEAFMPLIVAQYLVLASAAAALAFRGRRSRRCALLTCAFVIVSALTTLGVVLQLVAQVGGLGLLCALAAVLLRSCRGMTVPLALRWGAVGGILLSGQLLVYPELLPFMGLAVVLHLILLGWRRRTVLRSTLLAAATVCGIAVVLLNSALPDMVQTIFVQLTSRRGCQDSEIFPYFVVPSGLAALWGLQHESQLPEEPWLSLNIGIGLALLTVTAVATARLAFRGRAIALVNLVCLVMAVVLFAGNATFGLFKLAMYAQPFLLGTLVAAWVACVRRPVVQLLPLVLLALANGYTQWSYVEQSGSRSVLCHVRGASDERLLASFRQLMANHAGRAVVLDTTTLPVAKLQAWVLRGRSAAFACTDFFANFTTLDNAVVQLRSKESPLSKEAVALCRSLQSKLGTAEFRLYDPEEPGAVNSFTVNHIGCPPRGRSAADLLVTTSGERTILNLRQLRGRGKEPFLVEPLAEVHDRLLSVSSARGSVYYDGFHSQTSLCQIEDDVMMPGRVMAGLGRHLLFQVVNPSARVRLQLEVSTTIIGDHTETLPPAAVIGVERVSLPFTGRGSARVISPPLVPQSIAGQSYVAIDMGRKGSPFPYRHTGLMALWAQNVSLDPRQLTAFARAISLVSEEEYERFRPPSELADLPGDLARPDLEYSGIYEDGWLGEDSYLVLNQPEAGQDLVVRGQVPLLNEDPNFCTRLRAVVDGQVVGLRLIKTGDFEVRFPLTSAAGRRRVELHFDKARRIRWPDGRLISARLFKVGFAKAGQESAPFPPSALPAFPADLARTGAQAGGIFDDGWVAGAASCILSQSQSDRDLVVRGLVPEISGDHDFQTTVRVLVDGKEVAQQVLKTGGFDIRCPVPGSGAHRLVELEFGKTRRLPAPDGRTVGAFLDMLGFQETSGSGGGEGR